MKPTTSIVNSLRDMAFVAVMELRLTEMLADWMVSALSVNEFAAVEMVRSPVTRFVHSVASASWRPSPAFQMPSNWATRPLVM